MYLCLARRSDRIQKAIQMAAKFSRDEPVPGLRGEGGRRGGERRGKVKGEER